MVKTLHATQIGTKAKTLLRRTCRQWRVLAAVSGAVYITDRSGELLWITDRACALHARAILIPAMPIHAFQLDSTLESEGRLLRCEHFALGWQYASLWTAAPFVDAPAIPRSYLAQAIEAVKRALSEALAKEPSPESGTSTRFGRQITEAARRLRSVSTEHGILAGLQAVSSVVGLGQGLTPQGDDVLGGYLFALHELDGARSLGFEIHWESVTAWLYSVKHCTNAISHCLLVDHAHGDACAPLAALIRGALKGERRERLAQLASDVAVIGSTSGHCLLEGVLSAYDVARSRRGCAQDPPANGIPETVGRPARREVASVR